MAADSDKKIPSPVQLAHIVLRTTPEGHPKMMEFYKIFLGGFVTAEVKGMGFLSYDEEHHRIAIMAVPGLKPKDSFTSGLDHISFTYANINDLLLAYQRRKELGIPPLWCANHGATLSIYYRDPDGNTLETQIDILNTIDKVNEFIASDDFKENPYGVDFDPDELLEKLKAGVPQETLLVRKRLGPRHISTVPIA